MADIAFTTRLSESDWDDALRGWRCPPLAVPGAVVEAVYVDGDRIDSAKYEVLQPHSVIRWTPQEQPKRAVAAIKLTEALTIARETERWKKLAIVLPVIATIASAAIAAAAGMIRHTDKQGDVKPVIQGNVDTPKLPPTASVVAPAPPPQHNNSREAAREVVLGGPPIVGDTAGGERWYKFVVKAQYPVGIKVSAVSQYKTGHAIINLYNGNGRQISWTIVISDGGILKFESPQADTYYIKITPEISFSLTVSEQ